MVNTKDQSNAIVYAMLFVTLSTWRSKHAMHWMLCLSTLSTLVFVAFTQHCIQSNEVWKLYSTLNKVASCPCQEERLLKSLPSYGFSCSPVWEGSFVKRSSSCINSVDIDSIECIRDPCLVLTVSTYIVLMVWLKSPQCQLSKTFFGLKISWILRKLWAGMCECVLTVVSRVSTNIAFNALCALIFILTVLRNKIPYSIHNSIALIFCIDCLDMHFNVHSNYNADSNTKTSNYMKIWFKAMIYFELHETSK